MWSSFQTSTFGKVDSLVEMRDLRQGKMLVMDENAIRMVVKKSQFYDKPHIFAVRVLHKGRCYLPGFSLIAVILYYWTFKSKKTLNCGAWEKKWAQSLHKLTFFLSLKLIHLRFFGLKEPLSNNAAWTQRCLATSHHCAHELGAAAGETGRELQTRKTLHAKQEILRALKILVCQPSLEIINIYEAFSFNMKQARVYIRGTNQLSLNFAMFVDERISESTWAHETRHILQHND